MAGKHPVAVINVSLSPSGVDVNIHPAKSEVKFRDEHAVFAAVQREVRQALVARSPVPRLEETSVQYRVPSSTRGQISNGQQRHQGQQSLGRFDAPQKTTTPLFALPVLRVLGQLDTSYIIAEGPDGLYIIDQHAAHERIRFEEIVKQREGKGVEVQGLLPPVTYEVSPGQDMVVKSQPQLLAGFGFALEPFGSRTYLVRAVPAMLSGGDWRQVLDEALDGASGGDWQERLMHSMACHSAVRAGQVLTHEEMKQLVDRLAETYLPHTCPHGRPTMVHLNSDKLKRDFGRT
jgi:DNA mismatch repair protein MutL